MSPVPKTIGESPQQRLPWTASQPPPCCRHLLPKHQTVDVLSLLAAAKAPQNRYSTTNNSDASSTWKTKKCCSDLCTVWCFVYEYISFGFLKKTPILSWSHAMKHTKWREIVRFQFQMMQQYIDFTLPWWTMSILAHLLTLFRFLVFVRTFVLFGDSFVNIYLSVSWKKTRINWSHAMKHALKLNDTK